MKRIFLFALWVSAVLGFSVTGSYAQVLDPGCSQDVMNLLQNQADAIRARNRAYEREVLNREESTLYLTCFDQAMALSSRLGLIFSDNIPPDPPPANTVVFTDPLMYPDWGSQTPWLAQDLNSVVEQPVLDSYLDTPVPAPALYNFLPPWNPANDELSALAAILANDITKIAAAETAQVPSDAQYIALVTLINNLVNGFPTDTWAQLPPDLLLYTAYMQGPNSPYYLIGPNPPTVDPNSILGLIDTYRKTYIAPLLTAMTNDVTSNSNMTCTNLDDMWDKYNAASDFYPPEGQYFPLTPYYTLGDLLNYGENTATPGPLKPGLVIPANPPATLDFVTELQQATDTGILNQALQDLATGPYSQIGNNPLWPAPVAFPPNAQAITIIQQM